MQTVFSIHQDSRAISPEFITTTPTSFGDDSPITPTGFTVIPTPPTAGSATSMSSSLDDSEELSVLKIKTLAVSFMLMLPVIDFAYTVLRCWFGRNHNAFVGHFATRWRSNIKQVTTSSNISTGYLLQVVSMSLTALIGPEQQVFRQIEHFWML